MKKRKQKSKQRETRKNGEPKKTGKKQEKTEKNEKLKTEKGRKKCFSPFFFKKHVNILRQSLPSLLRSHFHVLQTCSVV